MRVMLTRGTTAPPDLSYDRRASSASSVIARWVSVTAASELGQIRAWHRDPYPARAEVDDQGGVILDGDDPAEAILIVCHLVLLRELLGRRSGRRGREGACGQVAPDGGAGRFHHYQYAPPRFCVTAAR
jgi:hypothetical protein